MSDTLLNGLVVVGIFFIGILLTIIGYFLVRHLQNNDESLKGLDASTTSLNETIVAVRLDMKDRVTASQAEKIAIDRAHAAVSDHVIIDHK